MTDKQPEALRLADRLTSPNAGPWDNLEAAAELRRLHEEMQEQCRINGMGAERELRLMAEKQELLEALKSIAHYAERQVAAFNTGVPYLDMTLFPRLCEAARAAIAKAEGETK